MASDRFEAIVAEGRRFGLGLTLSHQNISQLSTGLRNVLRNNVHTQIYFQTGALDAAELVKEIGGSNADEVKATLISQGVGQAFLVRRGQTSIRFQAHHAPDPGVDPEQVRAVRQSCATTYAQARARIEGELARREQSYASPARAGDSSATPTYEIRHSKTATFKPASQQSSKMPEESADE